MAATLDSALVGLFGGTASGGASTVAVSDTAATVERAASSTAASSATVRSLTQEALEHFERARAAQRADTWAAYGDEMKKLGEVLRRLDALRKP
jgi:uncharacterized membrane protein (UPF0182 family)